jgi:hypothetical protein
MKGKDETERENQPLSSVSLKGNKAIRYPEDFICKLQSPNRERLEEVKNYLEMAYDVEPTSAIMIGDQESVYFQFVKLLPKEVH